MGGRARTASSSTWRSSAGGAGDSQPYAVRFSAPAAKVLDTLPEHVEDMVWDVLDAAAADPWGFRPWNADGPGGQDVRHASVSQLSLTCWVNRPLRRLSVLTITWLG
ncbi:hypothetical protein [Streptomyces cucumeris]|uniref:hypothetical protein n=1 Tax=Streptomyces cucumeris TaxID=2962890 RepID=UPI0020C88FBD|nr:hypothetical protein [Streptomyces sp. NEAU-Y11]MCP9213484.1 hypothetical protein [Streptomyces sp. NEAU-Y11]